MCNRGKKSNGSFYLAENCEVLGGLDLSKLLETLSAYLETKIALLKWDAQDELHVLISKAMVLLMLCSMLFLGITFLSLGLSFAINMWLASPYLGYVVVAGLYLILAFLLFLNRGNMQKRLQHSLNKSMEEQKAKKNE